MEFLRKLWSDDEGQGLVEYGLIIVLVSVAAIAALGFVGGQLNTVFENIKKSLGGS